ncbi:hypothetical protein GCM10020254_14740 [Streptomyces goshikiensis]
MWQPERAAQWMDEALDALGLDHVHLVGSSYGGWLVINQAHLRPGRLASVTALDPGGLEKVGLRFFVWIFASLFATYAPKSWRPRLAAWLEQPVIVVAELRTWIQAGVRAFRIRRPAPLPLSDAELGSIRTPFYLIMGKRSLLVHPKRQLERVPRLIAGGPRRDRRRDRARTADRPPRNGQCPDAGLHGGRGLPRPGRGPGRLRKGTTTP